MVGKYWSWYNCSASGCAHLSTEASTVWICACRSTDWWPAEGCSLQLQPPWRLRRTSSYARDHSQTNVLLHPCRLPLSLAANTLRIWLFLCITLLLHNNLTFYPIHFSPPNLWFHKFHGFLILIFSRQNAAALSYLTLSSAKLHNTLQCIDYIKWTHKKKINFRCLSTKYHKL